MQLILAGGRASRLGGQNKALTPFRGKPLIEHVLDRLPDAKRLISARPEHADALSRYGEIVLDDEAYAHCGPLSGIHAGLHRAEGVLIVVPCDTPFLPLDVCSRLEAALNASSAAYARTADGAQSTVCGFTSLALSAVEAALAAQRYKLQDLFTQLGAAPVWFEDAQAFTNLNTADDLLHHAS
jgi:molybdenum cofactor guanylyltransferase